MTDLGYVTIFEKASWHSLNFKLAFPDFTLIAESDDSGIGKVKATLQDSVGSWMRSRNEF